MHSGKLLLNWEQALSGAAQEPEQVDIALQCLRIWQSKTKRSWYVTSGYRRTRINYSL